jgi:hypothetical protein
VDADAIELRVLGCLVEKQRTTPDVYPLSLNALRLACNQTTNRDPIVSYDESTIRAALERLSRKGWVRLTSGAGSRTAKYRHLLDDAIGVSSSELSVLAVLMLRGPQTPGELKQRTERMHPFGSLEDLELALDGLIERELVVQVDRRPGQKEARYVQLLGGEAESDGPAPTAAATADAAQPSSRIGELEARVEQLEEEVAALRAAVEAAGG